MHLICYDISEDSKRQKVADKLIEVGCYRLQKSVFAGDLSATLYTGLLAWLKKFHADFLQADDSVLILACTTQQLQSAVHIGAVPPDWNMLAQPPNTLIV